MDINPVVFVNLKKRTVTMTEEQAPYEVPSKKEIKDRIIRVKLIDGSMIHGRVNLNRSEGFDRVSDLVVSDREQFLILIDATAYEIEVEKPIKYKTLFINKNHIIWASPDEDQK